MVVVFLINKNCFLKNAGCDNWKYCMQRFVLFLKKEVDGW